MIQFDQDFFQKGWNHQLVFVVPWIKSTCEWCLSTWHRERFCIAGHLYRPRFLEKLLYGISVWQQCHCPLFTLVYWGKEVVTSSATEWTGSGSSAWTSTSFATSYHCISEVGCDACWLWWMLRGWVASKKMLFMAKNAANQLMLVVYPIIYSVKKPSQVVVCDFWTINSSTQRKIKWRGGTNAGTDAARVEHANQKSFFCASKTSTSTPCKVSSFLFFVSFLYI